MSNPKGAIDSICGWSFQCEGAGDRDCDDIEKGIKLENSLRLGFRISNNETEYEAFITGLRAMKSLRAKEVEVYSDLRLVVSQIEGSFEVRDHHMSQYLRTFEGLQVDFQKVSVVRVSRSQNSHANSLDNSIPRMINAKMLERPSIEPQVMVAALSELESCWMDPYIAFLLDETLPGDAKEVEKVRRTEAHFWLSNDGRLFRHSFSGPYLLCLHPYKTIELLVKLYEGLCGGHLRGQSFVHRATPRNSGGLICNRK